MDDERFQQLLEEATVDCYDEEEAFMGVLCTLGDNLHFPLKAEIVDARVTVHGLDEQRSSRRRGIIAEIVREGHTYYVGLSDLKFIDPDNSSAEWIEMYRRWSEL